MSKVTKIEIAPTYIRSWLYLQLIPECYINLLEMSLKAPFHNCALAKGRCVWLQKSHREHDFRIKYLASEGS